MDVASLVSQAQATQGALAVIGALMMTAYLLPPQARVADQDEFDFIVVGAGSAGGVLADRLSQGGLHRVLVVDAGGDPPVESLVPSLYAYLPRTINDWNYTSEAADSPACTSSTRFPLTSGRVLGGGSSVNYMFYVRGAPADYDAWAAAASDHSWSWHGVLPYFIKSENLQSKTLLNSPYSVYHGTTGFHKVTRESRSEVDRYLAAFGELHDVVLDINGHQSLGYTRQLYSIADGIRQTTAYTNLGRNKHRPNLHVLKHALVVEILFDDNNKAIGVRAVVDDREITLRAKREVIVSAGGLNSPKLLMLSGIGPREHLESLNIKVRSDLPVGHNYDDHVVTFVSIKMEDGNEQAPPLDPGLPPLSAFTGYVALDPRQAYPDYQAINYVVPDDSPGPAQFCAFNIAQEHAVCQKLYEASKGKITLFTVVALLHPQSRGRLTLRSRDPADPPRVCTGTFSDESDLETLASSVQDYLRVLNTTYFKKVNAELVDFELEKCGDLDIGSKDYWKCYIKSIKSTMFHYSGTCALGPVVDARLRVRGVRGVRVVDASVMPELVSGNINAAVIMIAEKASDIINEDYLEAESHSYFVNSPMSSLFYW